MDYFILQASQEAVKKEKRGQELTPFLLGRLNELTDGRSLRSNLALLLNNAHLAAQIAKARAMRQRRRNI
jgi:pseudouridine-5'-phosphate glycosidase